MKARRLTTALTLALALAQPLAAQDDPEYRAEIGGGLGLTAYQGDLNSSLTRNARPAFTLIGRYKPNPRVAYAAFLTKGAAKGEADGAKTYYPADPTAAAPAAEQLATSFKADIYALDLRLEYNFWPYGTGREYRGAKPLVPYMTIGLGACLTTAKRTDTAPEAPQPQTKANAAALEMPLGIGIKYKIATRLNLNAALTFTLTGTDKLDATADPYGIPSHGIFKNTDCYTTLTLAVTYDIWAKCRTCHNDL